MKKNFKFCTVGLTALAASIPAITVLSSCSNKSIDSIAASLKNSVLEEFTWICKHYRPTFNNLWFCERLVKRINKMGYEAVYDRSTYTPIEQQKDKPYGFNLYFDVPATHDGQDIPPMIIQAHTDMVTKSVEGYDWSQGVIPVIDEDGIMHSKDNKTSLGADDGIGVATILAFAKNANLFKHGKVRCLLTVDEEDGDSGAASIPSAWLQDFNYFLNLDGEHINLTGCGCGGCQQAIWQPKDSEYAATTAPAGSLHQLAITGLKGGHSAHVIHEGRINAVQLMFQVIAGIKEAAKNQLGEDDVRLIWAHDDTYDGQKKGTTPGTICNEAHFMISTSLTSAQVLTAANSVVQAQLSRPVHSVEDKTKVKITLETQTESAEFYRGITPEATSELCTLINEENTDYLLYGVIKDPVDPVKHPDWPVMSCNIGAFRMGGDVYPYCDEKEGSVERLKGTTNFYLEVFGRTSDPQYLGERPKPGVAPKEGSYLDRFNKSAIKAFTNPTLKTQTPWESVGYNYPWPVSAGNPINLLVHQAADSFGYEMNDDIRVGWIEMGAIVDIKNDMHIGTLGPELNDVHSVNEHLDTKTLVPMFKMFIYVLSNLKA